MNYNVTTCYLCNGLMTYRQVRESVYWLPDMDHYELMACSCLGFEHRLAHRACWKALKEKKRDLIRICSFKGEEPRSMGARV